MWLSKFQGHHWISIQFHVAIWLKFPLQAAPRHYARPLALAWATSSTPRAKSTWTPSCSACCASVSLSELNVREKEKWTEEWVAKCTRFLYIVVFALLSLFFGVSSSRESRSPITNTKRGFIRAAQLLLFSFLCNTTPAEPIYPTGWLIYDPFFARV